MIHATITDREAMESLERRNVVEYLRNTGWNFQMYGQEETFWHPDYSDFAIHPFLTIPDPEWVDYGELMRRIVFSCAKIENRSQLDIFVEMGGDLGKS